MSEVTREELGNDLVVTEHAAERAVDGETMYLFGHSPMFYWWPVWVFGLVMAGLTYFGGETVTVHNMTVKIYPNNLLGFVFTLVLFLVFLFTNLTMRGLVSGIVIVCIAFVIVLLAWLDLWDRILMLIPEITVYMNTGFYLFIGGAVFIAWALSFFIFDRMVYWRITPGQVVSKQVFGGGEKTFESTNVVFEEENIDFFKHGLLGLGACDLKMSIRGAQSADFFIPNVLFGHWKVRKVQDLIRRRPA